MNFQSAYKIQVDFDCLCVWILVILCCELFLHLRRGSLFCICRAVLHKFLLHHHCLKLDQYPSNLFCLMLAMQVYYVFPYVAWLMSLKLFITHLIHILNVVVLNIQNHLFVILLNIFKHFYFINLLQRLQSNLSHLLLYRLITTMFSSLSHILTYSTLFNPTIILNQSHRFHFLVFHPLIA